MADAPPPRGNDNRELTRLVVGALLVLTVILFALFNRDRVEVDWILFERDSRLIYVIVVSALLGALADRLFQRRRAKKPHDS